MEKYKLNLLTYELRYYSKIPSDVRNINWLTDLKSFIKEFGVPINSLLRPHVLC